MKITITNFFEDLKPHIPKLPSSEKYGEWFANYSKNLDAKSLVRFHSTHVDQIINTHNQMDKKMFASEVVKAVMPSPNKWGSAYDNEDDWKETLAQMMKKRNNVEQTGNERVSEIHSKLERQRFFSGFFNAIKDQSLNIQHLWLFDVSAEECQAIRLKVLPLQNNELPIVSNYPWSTSARNKILKNLCNNIWETHDIQLLNTVVALKMGEPAALGEMLFNRSGKWKDVDAKSCVIEEAMNLGIPIPIQFVPSLVQSDPTTTDLIWKILHAGPIKDAQNMTKVLLPNVLDNICFVTQLLTDQKLTPNCLDTLVSFLDTNTFLPLWNCINDEQKDMFLSPLCTQYLKKNKDPSLKKISEFVHKLSIGFPASEQKMVVLRMFAVLVGEKHQELGALLSGSVLEQASLQQNQTTVKRKM